MVTLDQERAAYAFKRAEIAGRTADARKYKKLAKGTPQMIMNSGLMPVLAFLCEKGDKEPSRKQLYDDISMWLASRGKVDRPVPLSDLMNGLFTSDAEKYRHYTSEALAVLRWIRQMASAVIQGDD